MTLVIQYDGLIKKKRLGEEESEKDGHVTLLAVPDPRDRLAVNGRCSNEVGIDCVVDDGPLI